MNRKKALAMADEMFERELGNVPLIAKRLSAVTTMTQRKAIRLLREGLVEYIADLMVDYEEVD